VFLIGLDYVEKKEGLEAVANWRPTPLQLADMKEHNYRGVVFYQWPAWVFLPEEEREEAAQKWSDAMARLAEGLRGLPVSYMILSEQGGRVPAEMFHMVLKYAWEGLTRGDPEAKIIGLNTLRWEWSRQEKIWGGLGGLKYVYAVGVHPYGTAPHGGPRPEKVFGIGDLTCMLRLDDLIRRYNGGKPKKIWASEFGLETTHGEPNCVTWEEQANYTARMITQFKTLKDFVRLNHLLWRDNYPADMQYGFFSYYNQPKPLAAALETQQNVRAYLFEQKDGRQMLAAWSVEEADRLVLPVQCDSVEMMDLMGVYHTLEAQQGRLHLDLTESPVFLTPAAGNLIADRWVQALTRYREIRSGAWEKDPSLKRLVVKVTNESDKPLEGTLRCEPPRGFVLEPSTPEVQPRWWITGNTDEEWARLDRYKPLVSVPVNLAPGEEKEYEFILTTLIDWGRGMYSLNFSLDTTEPLDASLANTSMVVYVIEWWHTKWR